MRVIPQSATIGVRAPHFEALLSDGRYKDFDWFEVHSENFFNRGGREYQILETLNRHAPISLHGVGLSLGSTDPIDPDHLANLKALVDDLDPGFISEHLSWGSFNQVHANDLLPMPYTEEAIDHLVARISQVQDVLKREILLENVSCYLRYETDELPEWAFVQAVIKRSGSKLLLDINNVYVNAINHGFDPKTFIEAMDPSSVKEMHLAGFDPAPWGLIDSHGNNVSEEVWALFEFAQRRFKGVPTVLERDNRLPSLDDLSQEAKRADGILKSSLI